MGSLRITFHFRVRDLLVEGLLGEAVTVHAARGPVRVTFPLRGSGDDDEPRYGVSEFDDLFPERPAAPLVDGGKELYAYTTMSAVGDGPTAVGVDVLRAEINVGVDNVSADNWAGDTEDGDAAQARLTAVVSQVEAIATEAVDRLLAWSRVRRGQTWLGPFGEPPQRIGPPEVVDLDAKRRLPLSPNATGTIRVVEPDSPWTSTNIEELSELVAAQGTPRLAATLISDAVYLTLWSQPPDPSRAVLIAAVACEVGVKDVLRRSADPTQLPLVELLLANPRDWSMAAEALFHKPLKEVAGTSLKEADKELFRKVGQLFQRRNALAHRGEIPTQQDAHESVMAAQKVVRWLTALAPEAVDQGADSAED